MQMLYNSDSFAVVQFDDAPGAAGAGGDERSVVLETPRGKGGYEIVDKFARKEIYLQGELADSFRRGVQALVEAGPTEEALDELIAGFTLLGQQPLVLH